MSTNSSIEWTTSTWNPVTGCTKVSSGCKNCYAERMSKRLKAMGNPNYQNGFQVTCHEKMVELPLTWKKPQRIFVNSMSDLFHEEVPFEFITRIFTIMKVAHWHQFQILTKRSERLAQLAQKLDWAENIWMGVSVEDQENTFRIDDLRKTPPITKFLSIEPLIGPISNINLQNIDWVIVGGESGPKSRPIKEEWVTSLRDQCIDANVPFFFKQWGGFNKKENGRILQGRTWSQYPRILNSISPVSA